MTYFFDDFVTKNNGVQPGREHWQWAPYRGGDYITPDGNFLNGELRAFTAHGGGFILPFFTAYTNPSKETMHFYSKEELLENLIEWEKDLSNPNCYFRDATPKEKK